MRLPQKCARTLAVLVVALVAVLGATGCGGGGSDSSEGARSQSDAEPRVVMPTVPTVAASATYDQADGEFLVMMIPHHEQALDMVELARTRATDPGLRAIADRISAAQGPEILVMSDWLVDHGIDLPPAGTAGGMGSMTMTGMLTPSQMDELAAADGPAFDRLFLAGMIAHHQGAVAMADDELRDGEDVRILELAGDVKAGQTTEIDRMQDLLAAG